MSSTNRPRVLMVFCLWAKNKVDKLNHKMVMTCLLGGPLNSSFILCSRIQTIMPIRRKKQPVMIHKSGLNGLRNAQAPVFNFLNGATTTNPDAANGCVKSTIFVRFVTMAISPTAASKKPVTTKLTSSV
uniref:Glutamate receptor n=1 Tax=Rhizophora mucronata TaxID=61149 RepID=A0A2P2IQK6_RHIMU